MSNTPGTLRNLLLREVGRRWQSLAVVVVVLVGISTSIGLYLVMHSRELATAKQDLRRLSRDRMASLKQLLEIDYLSLKATKAYFSGSEDVTRKEYCTFIEPLMERSNVLAMQWAPRVPQNERAQFEETVAKSGLSSFRIKSLGTHAVGSPASLQEASYPVLYTAPCDEDALFVGVDLATNRACQDAMVRSCDTGQIAATSNSLLTGRQGNPAIVRFFLPVYRKDGELRTVEDRRAQLDGFVVAIIRLDGLFEQSLMPLSDRGINIRMLDVSMAGRKELLAWHEVGTTSDRASSLFGDSGKPDLMYGEAIEVGGRRWRVEFIATPAFWATRMTSYPLVTAIAVALLTIFLAVYLIGIASYTSRMARMAAELAQTNQLMGNEMADRKRIEVSLRNSQAKYKTLYDFSHDAIMIRTLDRRCISANSTAVALFGCETQEELLALMPEGVYPEYQPDGSLSTEKAKQVVEVAIREGTCTFEWLYKRKDGTEFLALVRWTVVKLEGESYFQTTLRDITEQRRAEEALQASEKRFKALFNSSRDAIMIRTFDRKCIAANPAAVELYGCKNESELIANMPDAFYPEYQADGRLSTVAAEELTKHFSEDGSYDVEWTYKRMDGTTFLAAVCWTRIEIEGEVYIQTTARDITEQRWLEDMLRSSERRHRLFAENVSEMIWSCDFNGRFTYLSPSFEQQMGYPWGEDTGLTMDDIVAPTSREPVHDAIQSVLAAAHGGAEAKPVTLEVEVVRKDGTTFWTEGTANRMYDDSGQMVGLVGVSHNITERKKAEERQAKSLKRLEGLNCLEEELLLPAPIDEKFKKITETAVDLLELDFCRIWLLEPADLCDKGCSHATANEKHAACKRPEKCLHLHASAGRYTDTGDEWQRVPIGFSEIGAILQNPSGKCLINDVPDNPTIVERAWAKELGLVGFAGYRLRDAVGESQGILSMFAKHVFSDEDDAFMANLAEMTSRVIIDHLVAEQLRQAKELAVEANQAKSRFLANMSHEIRTPMTAILGYADLLMDPRINASSRNNYSAIIHRSGEHLLTLINDILDLSKIESGKLLLEIQPCNLVALLADVASLLRPRAASHHVAFFVEYATPIPETIQTDGARLRQAIINLAGNAIKFTQQGSVRLVAQFLPTWRNEQPACMIEVIDTGIGIRPEVLPNLFQPFSQGDASIGQRFGGTGLGLTISRHIAELLGGELTAASVWSKGSTFSLIVPTGKLEGVRMLEQPTEAEHEHGEHEWQAVDKDLTGVRILLAEDGFDNRELIRTILNAAGAQVDTAENGRIAIQKSEVNEYDLILMDMNMPEMDGYTATRNLRNRGYAKPILALTANAMAGDSQRCLDAGCNEHMAKPINRLDLIRTIAHYVQHETTSQAALPSEETVNRSEDVIISEFINDPDMASIIGGFVGRLAGQLESMRQSFAKDQYDELRRLAHMLKGAGGSYGYPSLTEASKSLESAAKVHDKLAAEAALDTLAAIIHAAENGFSVHASTEDFSQ